MPANDERARVRRKMQRFAQRGVKVNQALNDYRDELTAVYMEGRQLDPPMTYKEIAEIFGITEAAVVQKVNKPRESQAS